MIDLESPQNWLSNFLKKRNLPCPNGNPLFSYHMTVDEYNVLKKLVKLFKPKTSINRLKHKDWSACFVIWCAEWYRRDCCVQSWEWQPLWDELNFELEPFQRAEVISLGLESFWKRPIRRYESEHRNFLGSIFIEGGLPFKLINSPGNSFAESIRKTLNLYYQVELYGISLNELIQKQLSCLPVVFSESESVELTASIVKRLMSFSNLVDLDNQEDLPSKQLDSQLPNWRDSFPIPLDDETGNTLLDRWLVGASKANTEIKVQKDKLFCEHYFDIHLSRFFTQVSLPKKLTYKFSSSPLQSTYVELGLLEGTKRIAELGGAIAQVEGEKLLVPPRKKSVKIPRRSLQTSLFLDLSQSGIIVDMLEVNDSSVLLNEAPQGFIDDGSKYKLVGQGSFSTKHEKIFVLAPSYYEIEVLSGDHELITRLVIDGSEFNWFHLNGDFRIYSLESRFRVKTNATSTSSGNLYIDGDEILLKTIPARVYRGLPSVRDSEGNLISQIGLTLHLDNKPIDSLESYELFGKHYLSVKNRDGDTLLRRCIAVLPEDLVIDSKAGNQFAEVRVTASRTQNVSVIAAHFQVSSEKLSNGRLFRLSPENEPPANFTLQIQANLLEDPISITLPYPVSGIFAFDNEGQPLKHELTVEQLLGAEVNLYSAKTYPEEVSIELALKPINRTSPRYFSKVKVADRTLSVSLYSFKEKIIELMSMSNVLDAEVEINLSGVGGHKVFTIRRYMSQLNFDPVSGGISVAHERLPQNENIMAPMAMLIAEPERAPCELIQKEVGGISLGWYEVTDKMQRTGPWMLVPNADSPNLFRPTFYKGIDTLHCSEQIKSIQTAVKCFDPRSPTNTIEDYIKQMEGDFSHPSWNYFLELWKGYSYLPLATFEAWKALVENTRLLTLALFRFEMNEDFLRTLDTEFSILWELIPLEFWNNSVEIFRSSLLNLGLPEAMVEDRLVTLIDRFASVIINVPDALIDLLKGKPLPPQLPVQIIELWKQDLIREHSESDWPNGLMQIFERDIVEIAELKDMIKYPHFRQCSVALYPVVAAAIASGRLVRPCLPVLDSQVVFEIKKIKSFEPSWFSSVYSFALSFYLKE
ncbi:STY4851/ECs_5259 family protein [Pseudoalteromonas sp. JC3]|uniref:STY4851/ECs_5259 family protein n=1 Tax=Pseudoalteromonas sp. JC3 TaxID=2810196 RepID=UPI0019D194FD|nr:STY4851/ECs_5259 family protein [Pseudoalteromonas sp. JC3]MBR8842151.1 STY4851/ECs_5259 family protein [Pseudoalteromonas sp. JC3]WJE09817.1 STY4851/ECs_5259 family protein [Pseudoalteromonas sp. JC3]